MIKSNELRVGNWVMTLGIYKDSFERAGNVKVDAELIKLCDENKIGLLSISLTPEILEKCGFGLKEPSVTYVWKFSSFGEVEITTCKYLHQLQNLYFALTGEELKVNM